MPLMSGGDAVVRSLIAQGISTIYCLPGVQSDHLFNAMFDAGDAIRVVHTRHEQGAAYMALGAALATGRPAAYSVVPGPGFLNSSAALATAYSTGAQVLALIGQIPSRAIGKGFGFLHEINDQTSILRTLTKWAERAERLGAPVVGFRRGKGVLDNRHVLSQALPGGHALWAQADVVLAVGTRMFLPLSGWGADDKLKIIKVDVDPAELSRTRAPVT